MCTSDNCCHGKSVANLAWPFVWLADSTILHRADGMRGSVVGWELQPGSGSSRRRSALSFPTAMKFGGVAIGSQTTLTGTLTAGSSDISVTSAAWSGQGYSVSGITFPVTVAAGKNVTYSVTFAPQAAGDSPGSISFVNDGASSPAVQTLDGTGAQSGVHTVGLSWDASPSSVIGYNVYRGTQSGGPYQLLSASPQPDTTYSDNTVLNGFTYYYVATAVNSSNVESIPSNEAQAPIPEQ